MGVLAASDRAAGSLARAATTLGQLALVSLGVHLAADRLDDHLVTAILAAQSWLDGALGEPLQRGASALGLASDTLLLWELVPVATVAAWAALLVELSAMGVFAMTFLLTNRSPVLSWSRWRDALGATALIVPAALLGVLLAGSWSMAMTVEDVLARRTRALFLNARASIEAASVVAYLLAGEFGHGSQWVDDQVQSFTSMARNYVYTDASSVLASA